MGGQLSCEGGVLRASLSSFLGSHWNFQTSSRIPLNILVTVNNGNQAGLPRSGGSVLRRRNSKCKGLDMKTQLACQGTERSW